MKKTLCALVLLLLALTLTASAIADVPKFTLPGIVTSINRLPMRVEAPDAEHRAANGYTTVYVADGANTPKTVLLDEDLEEQRMTHGKGAVSELELKYQMEGHGGIAYYVEKDNWTWYYTSGGEAVDAYLSVSNIDMFNMGMANSRGVVGWTTGYNMYGERLWYVCDVYEYFEAGELQSVRAWYSQNGTLVGYRVSFRQGEDGAYTFYYTAKNQPTRGYYCGLDGNGDLLRAYTATKTQWADDDTGKLLSTEQMGRWNLRKANHKMFRVPPRKGIY